MLECHWKSTLGVECMGCGFQRSLMLLFEGNVLESIQMFPAAIPLVVTIVYTAVHLKFQFSHGARNSVILFSITATIMLCSFIYKVLS